MTTKGLTIQRKRLPHPGLDQEALYALGLDHVRELSRRAWTDHNLHDPGITTLELLCYALSDLTYRATLPLSDLLASKPPGEDEEGRPDTLFRAREILPCAPLTELDYRKLLVDLPGIANAWLRPAEIVYIADTLAGELLPTWAHDGDLGARYREVRLRGVYDVTVELSSSEDAESAPQRLAEVRRTLCAHRSLCEDFAKIKVVDIEPFVLCGELLIAPDADPRDVWAEALFRVQQYLTPPVRNYTLEEMRSRPRADGTLPTLPEIFEGPLLRTGFIDDEELLAADLRAEVRLSDVIGVVMDVPGVRAVNDLIIHQRDIEIAPADKWVVKVGSGMQPRLDRTSCRLVMYKRGIPTAIASNMGDIYPQAEERYRALESAARAKMEAERADEPSVPKGRPRDLRSYTSFQKHFPALYGLSDAGFPGGATPDRKTKVMQLKAYLLFFDQVMADYLAQLASAKELFSTDPELVQTYFHQLVTDLWLPKDAQGEEMGIYDKEALAAGGLDELFGDAREDPVTLARRHRFLDHLISRFAERFHEYAMIMRENGFGDARELVRQKCAFLNSYPEISARRGAALDVTVSEETKLWDPGSPEEANLSGLEARVGKLLGIPRVTRRTLTDPDYIEEGLFVIEDILLRPYLDGDPFLPICEGTPCVDCGDLDPYSCRVHVIFPAYAGRFRDMDFRRFAEEVVRREAPAHVLPKICWVSAEDMARVESAYHDWLLMTSGISPENRPQKTQALVTALVNAKNVYPTSQLAECDADVEKEKFILGRSALGSIEKNGQ